MVVVVVVVLGSGGNISINLTEEMRRGFFRLNNFYLLSETISC